MTNIMKAKLLLTGAVLCLSSMLATAGTVYKWTDSSGVVHYGDQSPTGVHSQKLSISTGRAEDMNTPDTSADKESSDNGKGKDGKEQGNSDGKGNLEANAANLQAQRKHNCELARKNLQIIRDNGRIRIQGKDGKQRYLTPDEIEAKRKNFERIAKDSCN